MRTRYLRIRPLVYASTSCLLSSSTLNCVFGHVARVVAPPWLPPLAEVPESTYRDSFAGAKGKPRSGAGYHTRGRISRISRDGEREARRRGVAPPESNSLVATLSSAS